MFCFQILNAHPPPPTILLVSHTTNVMLINYKDNEHPKVKLEHLPSIMAAPNHHSLKRHPLTALDQNRSSTTRSTLRLHLSRELIKENNEPLSPNPPPTYPDSSNVWDQSDSEAAAPASSWSNLPNRTMLCRPLPVDVGTCTCVIIKEKLAPPGHGHYVYSLYTNEGKGRQDRKLAIACHKRKCGRSVFVVAQNVKGMLTSSDENFLGTVTSNLMGSKYQIWDQGVGLDNSLQSKSKLLQAVILFSPTISTWTGNYRSIRAWITKHQKSPPTQLQVQRLSDWETQADKFQQLFSRPPRFNNITKQNELDFRDRGKSGHLIRKSVKNFQLAPEITARQTSLQLGRVGKCMYLMDYRYPLTGYQAFCICLASIDSKLCCTF